MPIARELTAGLLPPRLRDQFGLAWGPRRNALLDAAAQLSRLVRPLLPSRLAGPPAIVMPDSYTRR